MKRKRTSLRRWKARCHLGKRAIPVQAIIEHRLTRWFVFKQPNVYVNACAPVCMRGGAPLRRVLREMLA
jgi:hypothetical protein